MSYILEALKKSDLQRQRGATPTLQAAQFTVAVPKRPMLVYYSLLAAVLLVTGIVIGWLRPWQSEQAPFETEPLAAEAPISITEQPVLKEDAMKAVNPAYSGSVASGVAAPVPDKVASHTERAKEQKPVLLEELPIPIQQEIPAMTVQFHAYSSKPSERLVSINSIRLREGGSLMLGLRLEQITPDGMIFSYKGYRFLRGIQ